MVTVPAASRAATPVLTAIPAPPPAAAADAPWRESLLQQQTKHRHRNEQADPLPEGAPRTVDRLPDRAAAEPQRGRDLLVAQALQLPHHDRRPLRLGKLAQTGHQPADLLSLLRQLLGRHAGRSSLVELERGLRLVPDVGQRRVADDSVEPGTKLDLLVAAAQREVRLRERLLGDVIRPLSGDDRGGVAAQGRAVAAEDLLEGRSRSRPGRGRRGVRRAESAAPVPRGSGWSSGRSSLSGALLHSYYELHAVEDSGA